MPLHFEKIQRGNLPTKIEGDDYIFLCDDGSIFTNTKTGALKQMGGGIVTREYRTMAPAKYYVQTDTGGDYVSIPGESITTGTVSEVEGSATSRFKTLSYQADVHTEYVRAVWWDSGNHVVMSADTPTIRSWVIPLTYAANTPMTITLKGPSDRFRIGYLTQEGVPQVGDKGATIVSSDTLTTYTFSLAYEGPMWLLIYCCRELPKIADVDITLAEKIVKFNIPNWTPKFDNLENRVTALEDRGLPLVQAITRTEPVGYSAIITSNPPRLVTHTDAGWFGIALEPF